ncbi:hypothetical protein HK096_000692, partial [Nowakowskiella sp. JEL0078]
MSKEEAQKLLTQGRASYALKHFDEAVECFSNSAAIFGEIYGETAPECAPALYWYGNALFSNALQKNSLLDESKIAESSEVQNSNTTSVNSGGSSTSQIGKILIFNEEDEEENEDEAETGEGENEDGEQEENEEDDDMSLAWTVLDLARTLLLNMDGLEHQKMLAETYLALGDISLEQEQWDRAVSDYTLAVNLKQTILPPHHRQISEAHFKLALAFEFTENYEKSIHHVIATRDVLERRLQFLKDGCPDMDPTKKEKENFEISMEMIPELQAKVDM